MKYLIILILIISTNAQAQTLFEYLANQKNSERLEGQILRDRALTNLFNQQAESINQQNLINRYESGMWNNYELERSMRADQAYRQAIQDAIHGNGQKRGW